MNSMIYSIEAYQPQNSWWRTVFTGLLGLLFFLFTACEEGTRNSPDAGTTSETAGIADLDDEDIARMIDYEYVIQDGVNPNNVHVEVDDGIVTLTGTVNHMLARDRAVHTASMVKGVRGVVDNLAVYQLEMTDALIKDNVVKSLYVNPATESYDVQVKVTDGTVHLTGTVDSWQEGQLVKKVVKGVAGVSDIVDKLEYDFSGTRPDIEIENEIEEALQWDVRVDARNLEVDVLNGEVTLSGVVGSAREKQIAEDVSMVRGATSIQSDDLAVNWQDVSSDLRTQTANMEVDDGTIAKAVEDGLRHDPRITSERVDAAVEDGRVTLSGTVGDLQAKNAAEQDARNVVGVWSVVNLLKVSPDDREEDGVVETRVEEALERDPAIGPYEVLVAVLDGKVVLTGEVDNYFEKYRAGNLASSVKGTTMVDNNIIVDDDAIPYSFDPYSFTYEPQYSRSEKYFTVPAKTDYEIKLDIEEQLEWSPFVDSQEIEVQVDNGTATLTGLVNSWKGYWMAEKNALEGGASNVHNKLEVVGFEIM